MSSNAVGTPAPAYLSLAAAARHSALSPQTLAKAIRGEAMVSEGPDGKRYFLAIHPFKYRPIADPGSPETLHPGPVRAGEIAVVPMPPPLRKINGQFRIVPADAEAGPRAVPRVPID